MNNILTDILLEITHYLHYVDLLELSLINRRFNDVLKQKINKIKTWYNSRARVIELDSEIEEVIAKNVKIDSSLCSRTIYESYHHTIGEEILKHFNIKYNHGDVIKTKLGPNYYGIIIHNNEIQLYKLYKICDYICESIYFPPKFYYDINKQYITRYAKFNTQ